MTIIIPFVWTPLLVISLIGLALIVLWNLLVTEPREQREKAKTRERRRLRLSKMTPDQIEAERYDDWAHRRDMKHR